MNTYIIAEAGVNHNGSLDTAIEMVHVAHMAGADAIKFQTFKSENLVTRNAQTACYQKQQTTETNQLNLLKNLELSLQDFHRLKTLCCETGIEFLSTPFDLESVNLLEKLDINRYKIPSGEITNFPLLKAIAQTGKPVILSTGMSNMQEIGDALDVLVKWGAPKQQITVLHANTQYPTPMEDVHLRAMPFIGQHFKVDFGYSDHTLGIEVDIAAVALGAKVIEKHFTLDKNMAGPDHQASLEPHELTQMVAAIRNIEKAMGLPQKQTTPSEKENLNLVRKSIVAQKPIKKGEHFTEDNITTKRPGYGISPMQWESLLGTKAPKDYQVDELI